MRISKDPDVRRQELISIAKELFVKNDFNEVKVSDIVEKANVAKGTYYYYFKSKEDVVYAIVEEIILSKSEGIRLLAENRTIPVKVRFEMLMGMLFKAPDKDDPLMKLMLNLTPMLHQAIDIIRTENVAPIISALIKEGCETGIFRPLEHHDVITQIIYNGISQVLHDFPWQEDDSNELKDIVKAIEELMELLLGIHFDFLKEG